MLQALLHQSGPIPLHARIDCAPGELLALVGPSGSGKTSALRAIAGLLRVAEGRISLGDAVWFDAEHGMHLPAEQRPVGMVFQHYALFPHLSALDNVRLALPAGHSVDIALHLLADMQLDGLAQRRPHELSGGQRQRVAIARATVMRPALLLADEPTGNLDRATGDEVVRLLEALNAQGVTLVVVTHDKALGDRARRRVGMEDGAVCSDVAQPGAAGPSAIPGQASTEPAAG